MNPTGDDDACNMVYVLHTPNVVAKTLILNTFALANFTANAQLFSHFLFSTTNNMQLVRFLFKQFKQIVNAFVPMDELAPYSEFTF